MSQTKQSQTKQHQTKNQSAGRILVAFLLNLGFSIFEFIGGAITGSVAISSDAVHDLGDAASIGVAFFLEKLSKKSPNDRYTYGYLRYSVLGGLITTVILLAGSAIVIYSSVMRIISPVEINYSGVIWLAIIGVVINFIAVYFTRDGDSVNQKSVNLHMLEDVLGWVVVLIGAIIMNFTNISLIDPILSIGVALFILVSALKNFKEVFDLFLEKAPKDVSVAKLKKHILKVPGVDDVHHIHVWSLDGVTNYATMHVVCQKPDQKIKEQIREELHEHNITHVTIELETPSDHCHDETCHIEATPISAHHHHHH